jgi:alpha-beta hydrolase superfamily lysophospholipase
VAVHRTRGGRGEEGDGCPDHALAVVQADGVAAGMRERAQQVRRHSAVIAAPHLGEHVGRAEHLVDGLERTDLDARRSRGLTHTSQCAPEGPVPTARIAWGDGHG